MNHGIWDGTTCLPTIAVLVDKQKGAEYPISQLHKKWVDSEQELECAEPHYHAYIDPTKGGIIAVKDCKGGSTLEEPNPRGCAFGMESEVTYIDAKSCEAFTKP